MIFWTHKIFLAMTKNFFEYHVGVENAKTAEIVARQYLSNQYSDFAKILQASQGHQWPSGMSPFSSLADVCQTE